MSVIMMGYVVRRVFSVMLLGASLAVASCGSDDDSPEPSNTAGTTDRPDLRSQIPDIPEIPEISSTQGPERLRRSGERGSGDAGSTGKNQKGSRSPGGDTSPGATERPSRKRSKHKQGSRDNPGSEGTPQFSGPQAVAYDRAREICANVTLEGIAVNLRTSSRDPAFVAKAFSRRYPAERREAAYEGCREGFRNQVELRR